MNLRTRLPSLNQLASVYSVAVVIIYSWSILHFFWRLPSFLGYSLMGEIGITFSYLMTINLLESLVVLLGPLSIGFILPAKMFRDRFVTKGSLLVLLCLGYMMYIAAQINTQTEFPYALFKMAPLVFVLMVFLVVLLDRIALIAKLLEIVTSKLEVFLYVSVPVSMFSALVVLVRNLF